MPARISSSIILGPCEIERRFAGPALAMLHLLAAQLFVFTSAAQEALRWAVTLGLHW